jgi:F-type H+-transporting ATPase subunit gamma
MPNIRDIRRRIRSVQSTQQITKAMKMVAAAKLRRSQERMMAARPYASKMLEVLNSLATRAENTEYPLLAVRPIRRVHVVVVTADRGLCGGFNTNIVRAAADFLRTREAGGADLSVSLVGRKGRDAFKRRPFRKDGEWTGISTRAAYEDAETIARRFIEAYSAGEWDAIYLVYNEFKSVIAQNILVEPLLPIQRLDFHPPTVMPDYLYEPTAPELFGTLLPKHVTFQVFRALLESAAAENAARMTAMEGATNNARDMIDRLTLFANRVRQAAITKEIIEVVSGAQAQG